MPAFDYVSTYPVPSTPPMLPQDINDSALAERLRRKLDQKTKPLGALGRLESLALQIGLILGTDSPELRQPQLLVCAGDHGLVAQGISAYPSDVTWQMVDNFMSGGAAASVLARQHGIALTVVDCGVRHDFAAPHAAGDANPDLGQSDLENPHPHPHSHPHPQPRLLHRKLAHGTADSLKGPAMTAQQRDQAIANGRDIVASLPGNALLLGEMGIGNSSSAALLLARLTGQPISECTGAGTGLEGDALQRKVQILREVLAVHADATGPLDALAAFGGFEIATLVGATLQAACERRVIVVDGFIATAAVLVAAHLAPHVVQRCVFAHRSGECGHGLMLRYLGPTPSQPARALLDMGMRLGEGSGSALAWPLLVSATLILSEMASFESAGVSGPVEDGKAIESAQAPAETHRTQEPADRECS